MNLMKGLLVFIVAFIVAAILIFTFMQEPFRQLVPARILAWRTPAIPIYAYVAGAFGIGLLFGLGTALYNFIVLQAKMYKKNREIHELETQLSEACRVLDMNGLAVEKDEGAPLIAQTDASGLAALSTEQGSRQDGGAT